MSAPEDGARARPRRVLPALALSQLAATSLWFAGNAVVVDLQAARGLGPGAIGGMTTSVQLGFIAGTLVSAVLGVADRFPPRRFFLGAALFGALCNLGLLVAESAPAFYAFRFLTGLALAGVYPIGMKIAAAWYREGLGRAIGWLVGALVVGTALPHGLRALDASAPWQSVIVAVSLVAAAGGLLLAVAVPDGPYLPARGRLRLDAVPRLLAVPDFRASVFGYFGHMWELYTLWTFVPLLWLVHGGVALSDSGASFLVIAAGAVGCVGGGFLVRRIGSARVAGAQLFASGACCLALPFLFAAPASVFLAFLVFWGVVVVGDSPQFSTLNARTAPPDLVGSGLAFATSVGFALTIASVELTAWLQRFFPLPLALAWIAIGPALGLVALRPLWRKKGAGG